MDRSEHMRIGEVADRVGLSLRTVRYYEEVGLVRPVDRTPGGYRVYDEAAADRLMVIRDLKPLGFSLDEIREIVALVTEEGSTMRDEQLQAYVERARKEHARAVRSLGAAERIIETLESFSRD